MRYTIGDDEVIRWIREATPRGLNIGAAIPPGYASYATVVIADHTDRQHDQDRELVDLLRAHSTTETWWLGYLDTGGAKIPAPRAPRVRVYGGWQYVLLQAGPEEALSWRAEEWDRTLPDIMFPQDRGWLVSTLWDDDWRCVGGPVGLTDAMLAVAGWEVQVVDFDEDATPPGHVAR